MEATAAPGRVEALDGLRGAAAVIVVLYHAGLIMPALETAVWPDAARAPWAALVRVATFLPHVLLLGTESVMLFFVLSGFVLVRPALTSPASYPWLAYYPRRIVRLLLPVAGAIALGAVLVLVVPRHPGPHLSAWLRDTNSTSLTVSDLTRTIDLLGPLQPLDNPLWSLGWELLFSLLLPVAVLLTAVVRRALPLLVAAVALIALGRLIGDEGLTWLPMFVLGAAAAAAFPRWRGWIADRVDGRLGPVIGTGGVLLALLLMSVPWIAGAYGLRWMHLMAPVAGLGCLLLVVLAATLRPLVVALSSRPFQWLGRISYSLYLVHVPVLVTFAYLVGPARWPIIVLAGIPAAILLSWGFSVVVERPSHRLAHRIGRLVERRFPPPGQADTDAP